MIIFCISKQEKLKYDTFPMVSRIPISIWNKSCCVFMSSININENTITWNYSKYSQITKEIVRTWKTDFKQISAWGIFVCFFVCLFYDFTLFISDKNKHTTGKCCYIPKSALLFTLEQSLHNYSTYRLCS